MRAQVRVDVWCYRRGIKLRIHNGGHHWIFDRGNNIAEWWPSSAKLVLGKNWRAGIHVHDWTQLIEILQARWALE